MSFIGNNQRNELAELQQDLNDLNFEKKKEAIKKVIAYMTVGKDVSLLFQSVIKCLEFPDIEMKKLIYLYIVNYSRQKPDDAIMVIQNFRKDVRKSENPLVRALAIRSFGCLRVPKLNDYLIEPLKACLADEDPYVRKTAVLCVAKVHEVSPDGCAQLVDQLQKMLVKESNALVLANLIQTLKEIGDMTGTNLILLNPQIIQKLLLAIDECIEWGQIFILDFLVQYDPIDSKQAEIIIERTLPRLSHINPTVTFCACKVILKYLDFLDNGDLVRNLCKKISPSLVSLLSSHHSPELQYVVLRNLSLIIQKFPVLFENEVKTFFCSFSEPYYVKYEKLDLMVRMCDNKNFGQVLDELHIQMSEADPDFVRKTIKSIGKIAIQYEKSVDKSISIFVEYAKNVQQANEAVQELLIQSQLIYRKYKNAYKHDDSLKAIIGLVEYANEPESKAAASWIIGEFGEYIPNAIQRMKDQIENFPTEDRVVQLQILTSCVKLFLKYSVDCEALIMNLLQTATVSFNPDVRDRAYIYWRLLSSDPEMAKKLICQNVSGQQIQRDILLWDTKDLVVALENMGSISNLFHKLPHQIYKHLTPKSGNKDVKIYSTLQEPKEKEQQKDQQKEAPKEQPDNKPKQQMANLIDFAEPEEVVVQQKAQTFELI